MLGRVGYALAIGILLGIIASGGGLYAATRRGAAATEARGDANAPFELALTISEAFFTDQLNHPRPAQAGEPAPSQSQLRDAAIRLRADGRIEVQGKVPVFGVTVPVRAVLLPRIVDNQLQMALVEGQAGGIGVPAVVATDVENAMNRQVRAALAKNNVQIVALKPGDGVLTIHLK